MAETHFTALILVLSVFLYGCSCRHTGAQDETQDVKPVLINGLREQMMEDTILRNWSKSVELMKRSLDSTTIVYKQLTDIIRNGYDPEIAVEKGYIELIQVVLDNGLPINKRFGFEEFTMLHGAAYFGQYKLVNFLIKRGADLNVKNKYGGTPLHLAAFMGYVNIVQLLVESGADIDGTDNNNKTPLHFAALKGQKSVVQWLVVNGCDTTIYNTSGKTALDVADSQEMENIIKTDVENIQFTKSQEEALTEVYMCHKSPSRSIQESLAKKFGLPLKAIMLWFGKKRIDEAVGLKESFPRLSNIDDLTLSKPVNNHHTKEQSIVKHVRKKPKNTSAMDKSMVTGDTLKNVSLSSASKESAMKSLPESDPDLMKLLSFKRKHSDTVTDEICNQPPRSPNILRKKKRKLLDVKKYNDVSACINNVNIQQTVFENREKTNAVKQEESSQSSQTIMNTTQNSVTIYRCTICEEMLVSEKELQIHFKKVHSSKVYQCMVCNECFLTEDNLLKHSGKHPVDTSRHNDLKLNE